MAFICAAMANAAFSDADIAGAGTMALSLAGMIAGVFSIVLFLFVKILSW
jgi:hypothetical protein